jgi:hypothetical protein
MLSFKRVGEKVSRVNLLFLLFLSKTSFKTAPRLGAHGCLVEMSTMPLWQIKGGQHKYAWKNVKRMD